MENMIWTNELSVNVKEIDDQHRKFFDFLNSDRGNLIGKGSVGEINEFFDNLLTGARDHFATEEKYFEEFHYDGSKAHIAEHNKIIIGIVDYKRKFNEGKSEELVTELIEFMKNWLYGHIMDYDKKYVKCFNDHGLH